MPTLHVRNVPEFVYEALRFQAQREGRSIAAQAIVLLEGALLHGPEGRDVIAGSLARSRRARAWERFGTDGRRVVALAQTEARKLRHPSIGTEHILLALLTLEAGAVRSILEAVRVDRDEARARIHELIGEGDAHTTGEMPFTPRAKKVLERALREALSLGQTYVGAEHMLVGVAAEGEGVAARVLTDAGADERALRGALMAALVTPFRRPPDRLPGGEYCVVALSGPADRWEEQLNASGAEGWELFAVVPAERGARVIFRRPG